MLLLAVVVLLLFGAKRLPELGRQAGRGIRELRETVQKPVEEVKAELPAPRTCTLEA